MDDTWLLKCRDEACYYKHSNHWHLVEKLRPFIDFLVKCFCTVTVSMLDFFVFLQLYCIWFSVFEKNAFIFSPKNQHFLISDICFFFDNLYLEMTWDLFLGHVAITNFLRFLLSTRIYKTMNRQYTLLNETSQIVLLKRYKNIML